jgi:uncharacterized protein (TIGR00730 family)
MAGRFKRVAVYCGGSGDARPVYYEAARAMGRLLASRGIGVVYGGGRVGMMGAVAEAALEAGGEVIGVIPKRLMELELGHPGLTDLFVVDSMHARKSMMMHLADAYVAMPGGYGTLEELFEAVTWAQLNYHLKPVGLLDVDGYWQHLLRFVDHAAGEGFVRPQLRGLMFADPDPVGLLTRLEAAEVPRLESWLKRP